MDRRTARIYRNEFLYFAIGPDAGSGQGISIYCSGVNLTRFLPITKGRHRLGQNPAVKGLQLVNLGVRDRALSQGAVPKTARGSECAEFSTPDDVWYSELLKIEKIPPSFADTIFEYCVLTLLRKIFKAIMLDPPLPDSLPPPEALQDHIDDLCRRYGGETAGR